MSSEGIHIPTLEGDSNTAWDDFLDLQGNPMRLRRPPGPANGWTGLRHVKPLRTDLLGYVERLRREYGDIVYLRIGPYGINLLSHPNHLQAVLIDRAEDYRKPLRMRQAFQFLIRGGIALNDGPEWVQRRKLVQQALARLDYEQVAAAAGRYTERMVRHLAGGEGDASEAIERVMIGTAVDTTLGEEAGCAGGARCAADQIFDDINTGLGATIELIYLAFRRFSTAQAARFAQFFRVLTISVSSA